MQVNNAQTVVGNGEHKNNKQSKTTLVERLKENASTIRGNLASVKELNSDLEVKALERELRRRAAIKAGEDFEEEPVKRLSYNGPAESTATKMDEVVDCLELLTGDSISEGYVPRDLLRSVAVFDPDTARSSKVGVFVE